jgi:hypothetical protein
MLHLPEDYSIGNKIYQALSNVIQLSRHFIYLDDFPGNQSVWINEARSTVRVVEMHMDIQILVEEGSSRKRIVLNGACFIIPPTKFGNHFV